MNRCSRSGRSRESTVYRKPNALGLLQTVVRHLMDRLRSDLLMINSPRSCASAGRSRCTVATRCCAFSPMSYVVAARLATASYIALRAASSATIACSMRPISTARRKRRSHDGLPVVASTAETAALSPHPLQGWGSPLAPYVGRHSPHHQGKQRRCGDRHHNEKCDHYRASAHTGGAVGRDEQISGANKQIPGAGSMRLRASASGIGSGGDTCSGKALVSQRAL
jgi:hypothetical protein